MDLIPMVVKRTEKGGERSYDLFSYLLQSRIMFIYGPIGNETAASICAQLLFLESISSEPIHMYICSPGGDVRATFAIIDTMRYINAPVHTWILGFAASAASLLMTCGEKGERHIFPQARVMIHEPSGGAVGGSQQIEVHAEEIKTVREMLVDIYTERSGQSRDTVQNWMNGKDKFLSAETAVKLGLADEVVGDKIRERNA